MFDDLQDSPVISLGEGNTPLVWAEAFGRQVAFKCEFTNPTGSFKDRGSALIASFLVSRGVKNAVEDSSGNAGASFAAYASRAGIQARVFMPDSASGAKRRQIEAYGAEIVRILGPRSNASEAVKRSAEQGSVYASHAYLPMNIPGYATAAYEIYEQLGETPGTVVLPVGQGGLFLGIYRGFVSMQKANVFSKLPVMVGVQTEACAPLWALNMYGSAGLGMVGEGESLAEGIRVKYPLRGDSVIAAVKDSLGMILVVSEDAILFGRDHLARRGLYVEPTSAIIWDALRQISDRIPEPIVAILTGSGLKYSG